jgi:EmrB/QacA subfamily drug resistance transporter
VRDRAISSPLQTPADLPPGLHGFEAFAATLGICFVMMLVAFDQTVVGTALPVIVSELQGFALYSWVATAYLLLSSILVPIMGRMGDLFGRKRFVIASILIFTGASALCGLAQSMLELVLARALQGVGGGMLVGTAFAATADIFPDQLRRIKWQAMLSSAFGLANAIGPSLGGWLTEQWGWRAVFYVNLPIGIAAVLVIVRFLPRTAGYREAGSSIDWLGSILLAASIASFLLALEEGTGGQLGALLRPVFWGPLAFAAILFALFLREQKRAVQPILPLRLFDAQAVRLLAVIAAFSGWAMFSLIFYAPLLLQAGLGLSPHSAGIVVSPLVLFISVGSIINGRLHGRVRRAHRLLGFGVLLFLTGCLAVLAIRQGTSSAWMALAFGIAGTGLGFQLPNLTIQMQAGVERRDVGIASALVQTLRMLGSMVGAALAGVIVNARYDSGVKSTLSSQGVLQTPLAAFFKDPQILVSHSDLLHARDQAVLLGLADRVDVLVASARQALIAGVDAALWVSVVLCAIAYLLARRLPPMEPH